MAVRMPRAATTLRRGVAWTFALALAAGAPGMAAAESEMAEAEHIVDMAGCFSVTYRFFEDGEHDFFSKDYGLNEPMTLVNEVTSRGQRSITISNYAVLDDGRRIPHWHQVWVYLQDEEKWRQTVWGRAQDSGNREFRFTCKGRWQRNKWICDAGAAPKPFRDDGAPFGFLRKDYNHLDRSTTILVTPKGWVMSQQNRKLTKADELVSYETGWILYDRQPEKHCEKA